jgi:hypothetical protein
MAGDVPTKKDPSSSRRHRLVSADSSQGIAMMCTLVLVLVLVLLLLFCSVAERISGDAYGYAGKSTPQRGLSRKGWVQARYPAPTGGG